MSTQRFDELLGLLLDDGLDALELDELGRLVADSSELRERFRQQVQIDEALSMTLDDGRSSGRFVRWLDLRVEAETQKFDFLSSVLDRTDVQNARRIMQRSGPWVSVAVAVIVGVAFCAGWWIAREPVQIAPVQIAYERVVTELFPQPTEEELEPVDDSVAIVKHTIDATWVGESSVVTGDTVSAGMTLHLASGLVQLQFFRGAIVTLQGPARLEIRDLDNVMLREGQAWAHVPVPARGFTMLTPETEIVDLGTEFGVSVVPGGQTEVRVFDGLVELYEPGTHRAAKTRRELVTGEGVSVGIDGHVESLSSRESKMPSKAVLLGKYQEQVQRGYERWLAWSTKAKSDPRVLLYYSFDRQEGSDATLHDQSLATQRSDGTIIGCSWTSGRWPQKPALEFKRPSDRVRFHLAGEFESVTLAAWVRVDGLDRRFNSLLLTDEWDTGEIHWQFDRDGQLGFSISGSEGIPWRYSKPLVNLRRLGQWIHVATIFDGEQKTVRHYLNGQPTSPVELLDYPGPLRIGAAELGNWGRPLRQSGHPIRNFNGQMDEFILYDAALEDSEIQQMFNAGKPYE